MTAHRHVSFRLHSAAHACRSWLAAWWLALILAAPSFAATPPHTYRVEITAPDALAKLLKSSLDIERWSKRDDVTPERLQQLYRGVAQDAKNILATEGYFSPQVETALETGADADVVRIVVTPGEPARVASVTITIVGPVEQAPDAKARIERAQRAFRLKEGDIFRQADWSAAKERVVQSLSRRVYATAHIESSRAQIDPAVPNAKLELRVESGPPVTFGKLKITGLRRYPERFVTNLNPIPPGTPYDDELLLKYQRRLLLTGYFASAVVNAEPNAQSPASTPILVTLVEAEARRVEFGLGYSTDRGVRGQIDYSDKNLLDRGWRLSSNLFVDKLSQRVTGGIELPRRESGYRYAFEGKYKHEDIQNQVVTNWSIAAANLYTIEEYESSTGLQFLTERSRLGDGTQDNSQALFLNQGWTWNGLDDLLNPRKGYLARLQVGGASEWLLTTQTFGRLYGKISYLLPLNRRWTLGLRAEAGFVAAESRDGIPSAYVFRTGGDTTIRGYAFESLGIQQGDSIVGGRYLLIGSVEMTRWFTREWGGAVFYDTGNAFDDLHGFDPVAGYGVGARWRTPIGSLNLDVAYGQETEKWRLHFTAGIAFR